MTDKYAGLSNEEFDDRLIAKLKAMSVEWLAHALIRCAYEEISEEFNNEILADWESEQDNDTDEDDRELERDKRWGAH